jgi:ppGpp synthetase/RelA/SpoT-type nucleotidyltranferase
MDSVIPREKYLALMLEHQGQRLLPQVIELLKNSQVADSCYAFKIRIKPEEKLLEKIARKRADKPDYQITSVTDVVGLRLVALFRSDMIEILDGCLQAIGHINGVSPNPFCVGIPEEIIIYKGNTAVDDLIPHLREIITKNCGAHMIVREETSREGYSSIHLVARLTCQNLGSKFPSDYKMPIEIQIRTVFEDAWGEIDHKYGYAIRSGKQKDTPIQNPESVLAHLKVLKGFTDACMTYGEAIRQDATRLAPVIPVKTVIFSVKTGSALIEKLKGFNVPDELVARFINASDLKDEALGVGVSAEIAASKYRDAAEEFMFLSRTTESLAFGDHNEPGYRLLNYYSQLNQALCVMSMDDRGSIQTAMTLLREMETRFTAHPLLLMRIGQAYGKLGLFKEAILHLGEAKELAQKTQSSIGVIDEGTAWPDSMLRSDYEYILRTQPRLSGYYMWQQALTHREAAVKAQLFASAYEVTQSGLDVVGVIHSPSDLDAYHNNLLYYSVAYKALCDSTGGYLHWSSEAAEAAIAKHLAHLEPHLANLVDISVGTLDTLVNAYAMQKDAGKAKLTANELKRRVLKADGGKIEDALALRYIKTAEKILADEEWVLLD